MPLLRWLNFLSLDAILIALGWQSVFAKAGRITLTWQERALLGVSVGVVYILDHLLDASQKTVTSTLAPRPLRDNTPRTATLDEDRTTFVQNNNDAPRHHFAKKNRPLLLTIVAVALLADLWLALRLPFSILCVGGILGLFTFFYLLINTILLHHGRWLHGRELIISFIFAAGSALIPLIETSKLWSLLPWVVVFILPCLINCILIARMERHVTLPLLTKNLIPSPRVMMLLAIPLFLISHHTPLPSVALAIALSLFALSFIPIVAEHFGYEIASLATDGALLLGALTILLTA